MHLRRVGRCRPSYAGLTNDVVSVAIAAGLRLRPRSPWVPLTLGNKFHAAGPLADESCLPVCRNRPSHIGSTGGGFTLLPSRRPRSRPSRPRICRKGRRDRAEFPDAIRRIDYGRWLEGIDQVDRDRGPVDELTTGPAVTRGRAPELDGAFSVLAPLGPDRLARRMISALHGAHCFGP